MRSSRCDIRRRPSIILDAGYVSISTSKTFDLDGPRLICVLCTTILLVTISLVNFTCLIWLLFKLDWSVFDSSKSRLFRYDKANHKLDFNRRVTFNDSIITTSIRNSSSIALMADTQVDLSTDDNLVSMDDDQILLNADRFDLNRNVTVDFTNLRSFRFHRPTRTRVHLNRVKSHQIRNKHLTVNVTQRLAVSRTNQVFVYGQYIYFEANRHNVRSQIRFRNHPKRKNTSTQPSKTPHGMLHMNSDSLFFDLPRWPLLGDNHRAPSTIHRLCICNTTLVIVRSFAHEPCPPC